MNCFIFFFHFIYPTPTPPYPPSFFRCCCCRAFSFLRRASLPLTAITPCTHTLAFIRKNRERITFPILFLLSTFSFFDVLCFALQKKSKKINHYAPNSSTPSLLSLTKAALQNLTHTTTCEKRKRERNKKVGKKLSLVHKDRPHVALRKRQ